MGVRDTGEGTADVDKGSGSAEIVAGLISRARAAMRSVSGYDQDLISYLREIGVMTTDTCINYQAVYQPHLGEHLLDVVFAGSR
jgi:hypothetical protein